MPRKPDTTLYCLFCGKCQYEVEKLIQGPDKATICSECVDLCVKIVAEDREQRAAALGEPETDDS